MKKIMLSIILLLIIMSISCNVSAGYIDYTNRDDIVIKAFSEWIETFKNQDVPENRRIIDFQYNGYSFSESNPNRIESTIDFTVIPVSKENTLWNYSEPEIIKIKDMDSVWEKKNKCFLKMSNVNGEYKVDYIGEIPQNYEKFLEKFEEYKANHPQTEETAQIQGQNTTDNLGNQEIEKISHAITIFCLAIIFLIVIFVVKKFSKRNKKVTG